MVQCKNQIRIGFCQKFSNQNDNFQNINILNLARKTKLERLSQFSDIFIKNAKILMKIVEYCSLNQINAFKISPKLWPYITHNKYQYDIKDLSTYQEGMEIFSKIKLFSKENNIRLILQTDLYVLLNSNEQSVYESSIKALEYLYNLSEILNIDVIVISGGRFYGDKQGSLQKLKEKIFTLDDKILKKIALLNSDKAYSPQDLIPICNDVGIPLVYDVHHHRCKKDNLSLMEATQFCISSWKGKEPIFQISSPLQGWNQTEFIRHHDFIDQNDFPRQWLSLNTNYTLFIDSKSKELAVMQFQKDFKDIIPYIPSQYEEPTQINENNIQLKPEKENIESQSDISNSEMLLRWRGQNINYLQSSQSDNDQYSPEYKPNKQPSKTLKKCIKYEHIIKGKKKQNNKRKQKIQNKNNVKITQSD